MTQIINASGNIGRLKAQVTPVVLVDSNGNIINLSGVGTGDVTGSGSSLDEAVTRFNGTSGKSIQSQPTIFINDGGDFYCASGTQFNFIATPASAFQVTADNNINLTSNLHNISLNAAENIGATGGIDVNINASTGNSTISAGTNINLNTVSGNIGISSFADTNINSNGAVNIAGDPVNISVNPSFPNTYLNLINDQVTLSADGAMGIFSAAGSINITNTSGSVISIAGNGQIGIASAPNQKIILDAGSGNIQFNSNLSALNSGTLNIGSQSKTFKVAYIDILSGNAANQTARAWAHFSGVGGITVGDSYGVSSILRNTTGDYTVNWSTPFKSDRYCVTVSAGGGIATNFDVSVAVQSGSSCRITTNNLLSLTDAGNINVQAFGTI